MSVPRSRASGSFASGSKGRSLSTYSRIDRIGVADQRLDARRREPLRPEIDRRRGPRTRRPDRRASGRSSRRASATDRLSAPAHLVGQLLAGMRGEPLQPARGDLRLAVLAVGAGQPDFGDGRAPARNRAPQARCGVPAAQGRAPRASGAKAADRAASALGHVPSFRPPSTTLVDRSADALRACPRCGRADRRRRAA